MSRIGTLSTQRIRMWVQWSNAMLKKWNSRLSKIKMGRCTTLGVFINLVCEECASLYQLWLQLHTPEWRGAFATGFLCVYVVNTNQHTKKLRRLRNTTCMVKNAWIQFKTWSVSFVQINSKNGVANPIIPKSE